MAVNAELTSALKIAKTKPMFFAFVAKGNEGRLLVDKKTIPAKDADAAKKACGGGTIYKGRCLMEQDTMVFEVPKEAPGNLAALVKKIIKSDAALMMDVVVRVNADLVEGEKGEAGAAEGGDDATPGGRSAPTAAVRGGRQSNSGRDDAAAQGPVGRHQGGADGAKQGTRASSLRFRQHVDQEP